MKSEKEKIIDQILERGIIQEVIPSVKEFKKRLLSEKLRIYIGADPTSIALHLSHAKNYMLLEEFRKLGHEVIVLFGDFTARIGDPTDRENTRKQLSEKEIRANVNDWLRQIKPLMDFEAKKNPPRVMYNNDWLSKLSMKDVIDLASNTTVQRMLERDMFEKRIKEKKPIFLHEFMYPLMQGYDSVAMDVDVELCGTDQIFNALVGRTLSKRYNKKDKLVVAVNLMENPKTKELMSKSRGTGVFLNSTPFDMYGSIMSQPDEMIKIFLINNTRISLDRVEEIIKMDNLRDAKMITAKEIVKIFHGKEKADEAQKRFIKLVQKKEVADNVPEIKLGKLSSSLIDILRECLEDDISNSQIRRLIKQNSIRIDGELKNDFKEKICVPDKGVLIKIGKKKWFKVIL
ncbi:tyrosine--tRNA ligase [Candidatus Parcubacteria bacterium]|nr:tyrosine--tRNA ligase [Candidatus Parcubacteria bacterium]